LNKIHRLYAYSILDETTFQLYNENKIRTDSKMKGDT